MLPLQRLLSNALKRVMQCYPYSLCQQNAPDLEIPVVFNSSEACYLLYAGQYPNGL